eukprot:171598-Pelagomonas_calceolata.AAC.2
MKGANTFHINKGKGATLVQRPYDHPTTKFRLREVRQAENKDRFSNEKGSKMIAERLEFQTFYSKQSQPIITSYVCVSQACSPRAFAKSFDDFSSSISLPDAKDPFHNSFWLS